MRKTAAQRWNHEAKAATAASLAAHAEYGKRYLEAMSHSLAVCKAALGDLDGVRSLSSPGAVSTLKYHMKRAIYSGAMAELTPMIERGDFDARKFAKREAAGDCEPNDVARTPRKPKLPQLAPEVSEDTYYLKGGWRKVGETKAAGEDAEVYESPCYEGQLVITRSAFVHGDDDGPIAGGPRSELVAYLEGLSE